LFEVGECSVDGGQRNLGNSQVNLWEQGWEQTTLQGHSSYVWGVQWSSDGSMIASGGQDGGVILWDSANRVEVVRFGDLWVYSVSWSPAGDRLAVGTSRGIVQVWEVASGELLFQWQPTNMSGAISLGWSPDGSTLAEGLLNGNILLWDAGSGRLIETISGYTNRRADVNGLAWSPDGKELTTAHQDGVVRLRDTSSWELKTEMRGHGGWARGMSWSPEEKLFASTGSDGTVRMWERGTGVQVAVFTKRARTLWSVDWAPDGSYLAAGSGVYDNHGVNGQVIILESPSYP